LAITCQRTFEHFCFVEIGLAVVNYRPLHIFNPENEAEIGILKKSSVLLEQF